MSRSNRRNNGTTSSSSSSSSSDDNTASWPISEQCKSVDLIEKPVSPETGALLFPLFEITTDNALVVHSDKMYDS